MSKEVERIAMSRKELERLCVVKRMQEGWLTGVEAGSIMGISGRQARRLLKRFLEEGERGMIGKWKGCGRAYTKSEKEAVMSILSSKQYEGFKPTFASEKLVERSDARSVNRETLRQWMMSAGLWSGKKRNKLVTHQSRARRSCAGELVQIDGSHHDWFEGRAPKCCLLVFIDDATSSLMHMRFESGETTMGYFRCVKAYILKHGRPAALYSDRYGVFTVNVPDKVSGLYGTTQFQRAMKELKIEMILANSPQAKGRVE